MCEQTKSVAFLGTGIIAEAHLKGLRRFNEHVGHEALRLSHVIDRDAQRASAWVEKHFADVAQADRPEIGVESLSLIGSSDQPAIACVLLPHHLHLNAARPLLEAGIAVQMQKPIGLGIRDGRELCELARRYPLVVSEPSVLGRTVQAELTAIRLGEPLGQPRLLIDQAVIDLQGGFFATPWRHRKAFAGAGWFIDHGVHRTHWMLEAFGPCEMAFARTQQIEPVRSDPRWGAVEVDVEDCAAATLQFVSGVIVQFTVMSGGRGRGHSHVELWGDNGSLCAGRFTPTGTDSDQPIVNRCEPGLETMPEDPFAASFMELLDRMQDLNHPVIGDPTRALHAEAIIYACLESAMTGEAVRIEDILSGKRDTYEQTVWGAYEQEQTRDFGALT